MCVCVCVCACVRACVRACVCMDSLPSLSNPPQQPVPSNEEWYTEQSKVLQGLEHVLGRSGGDGGRYGVEQRSDNESEHVKLYIQL